MEGQDHRVLLGGKHGTKSRFVASTAHIVTHRRVYSLIASSRPSSMPCFSTTLFVCSRDSSRQAFRQICLQNRSAYYDDVSSGLHTFVIDVFIVFLHFRQTLSSVPSVFVSFSVYCPPFISCSYFIVWLFRLQSFSWGTLALISNQTDLSLDMVIRACRCIFLTGAYAHHVYHGPSPRY